MIGGGLAAIVVFFFLANVRATIIAALSIPTSIIAAFAIIHYMGFTLNSLTLLALTLSVGIVIDDAIVVMENIFRYIEEKKYSPYEAAHRGHGRNRPGRAGHHAVAGRRVPADRHDGRHRRPVPQVVRHHDGGHDHGEHVGQLHADADAGRPVVQEAEGAKTTVRRPHGKRRHRRAPARRARCSITPSKASIW